MRGRGACRQRPRLQHRHAGLQLADQIQRALQLLTMPGMEGVVSCSMSTSRQGTRQGKLTQHHHHHHHHHHRHHHKYNHQAGLQMRGIGVTRAPDKGIKHEG
eukprot:1157054-Pelagomonas_calceolata.AAC.4